MRRSKDSLLSSLSLNSPYKDKRKVKWDIPNQFAERKIQKAINRKTPSTHIMFVSPAAAADNEAGVLELEPLKGSGVGTGVSCP